MESHRSDTTGGAPEGAANLKGLRIIILAMVAGVSLFAAVASYVGPLTDEGEESGLTTIFLGIMGVAAVGAVVARLVLGMAFHKKLDASQQEAKELVALGFVPSPLASLAIVGCALFEGVGMVAGVFLLMEGHMAASIGIAFALVGMLFHYPTQNGIENAVRNAIGD